MERILGFLEYLWIILSLPWNTTISEAIRTGMQKRSLSLHYMHLDDKCPWTMNQPDQNLLIQLPISAIHSHPRAKEQTLVSFPTTGNPSACQFTSSNQSLTCFLVVGVSKNITKKMNVDWVFMLLVTYCSFY